MTCHFVGQAVFRCANVARGALRCARRGRCGPGPLRANIAGSAVFHNVHSGGGRRGNAAVRVFWRWMTGWLANGGPEVLASDLGIACNREAGGNPMRQSGWPVTGTRAKLASGGASGYRRARAGREQRPDSSIKAACRVSGNAFLPQGMAGGSNPRSVKITFHIKGNISSRFTSETL